MKATKILRSGLFLLLGTLIFSSCTNIQKMVNNRAYLQTQIDSGNYDAAIDYCLKKLRGKNKKKEKFVTALEKAFNRANDRDVRRMDAFKKRGDINSLESIISIAENIAHRQSLLAPLLPVIDKEGYQAEFRFVKVEGIIEESEDRVVGMIYDEGVDLLAEAEKGNKNAARSAHSTFAKLKRYGAVNRDVEGKMARAHDIGKTHIRFRVDNDAPVVLPRRFMEEVQAFGARDLNSFWNVFYITENTDLPMDYEIVMKVRNVEVSPESVREVEYIDRQEIEDGWEYVLDENGNVLKDTLGNDIKIPRYTFVEAFVFETNQYKEVNVEATLEFIDLRNRNLVSTANFGSAAIFENCAVTFRGDRRALSNRTRRSLGNRPIPFPPTEEMLIDAASKMKPAIKRKISAKRLI